MTTKGGGPGTIHLHVQPFLARAEGEAVRLDLPALSVAEEPTAVGAGRVDSHGLEAARREGTRVLPQRCYRRGTSVQAPPFSGWKENRTFSSVRGRVQAGPRQEGAVLGPQTVDRASLASSPESGETGKALQPRSSKTAPSIHRASAGGSACRSTPIAGQVLGLQPVPGMGRERLEVGDPILTIDGAALLPADSRRSAVEDRQSAWIGLRHVHEVRAPPHLVQRASARPRT